MPDVIDPLEPSDSKTLDTLAESIRETRVAVNTVNGSIEAADVAIAAHIADVADAHAGSAITNTPIGEVASTNVQSALNEVEVHAQQGITDAAQASTDLATHEGLTGNNVHGLGTASTRNTGASAGNIPLWENIPEVGQFSWVSESNSFAKVDTDDFTIPTAELPFVDARLVYVPHRVLKLTVGGVDVYVEVLSITNSGATSIIKVKSAVITGTLDAVSYSSVVPQVANPGDEYSLSPYGIKPTNAGNADTLGGTSHRFLGGAEHANVVAGGSAGFMTGADKSKLNGIEAGATGDQSAAEVPYSNTVSGLAATNTQGAIDEHVGAGGNAHAAATTAANGFMSSTDKTKLDGISTGGSAAPFNNATVYNSGSGSFATTSVDKVFVEVWGGGAGGEAALVGDPYDPGHGGGGGGYACGFLNTSALSSISYQVGAGGAGGSSGIGASGGTSSVTGGSNTIIATGGAGSGVGGSGTTGNAELFGILGQRNYGSSGGGSPRGGLLQTVHSVGTSPGGGGSGAGGGGGSSPGYAGAAGRVIIWY